MLVYKLTNQNYKTYNNTKWGEGVTHTAGGKGELCGDGWLHAYIDPRLAVILNPIHAMVSNPILWEAEAEGEFRYDHQLKLGCTKLTTVKQMPLPEIGLDKKIEFAIRCALKAYQEPSFEKWANAWLDGRDRTESAAWAAESAAESAARAARATWAAAWAARAAAWAAESAAWAARAAELAAESAESAARAARAANIDLLAILDECGIR